MSAHHGHDHEDRLSETQVRVRALESLLVEKGLVDPAALDALVEVYETEIGPRNGARVVARAWSDPAYLERLLADATGAIAELGFSGAQGEDMVALENTASVHNVVVCTLCSCYPWPVLGLPPVWYKSAPYRARIVREPRKVLAEFGVRLPEDTEVRVWDSTAELRYLVLPMRPAGTEGLDEEALAALVTRDAMIGTGLVDAPGEDAVNGAHDLGGMDGFGPVVTEPDEPAFHATWEGRVFALNIAMRAPGGWNIDESRFARETMDPGEYLATSYFEHWLHGLERLLLDKGFIDADEYARALERAREARP